MRYCQTCILPDTRPNLRLDSDGRCNACASHATKPHIDWAAREKTFRAVVDNARKNSKGYDCVIPVSGGKDSTWQVVKCLGYGLNPLTVTWKTPGRTELGQKNLSNLVALGVDHLDYAINPQVERKFMYQSLVRYGSTAIPMHMALFNIPLTIAHRFSIPLLVQGENSAFEYGGDYDASKGHRLDAQWLKKFGVMHGTTARDWVSEDLTIKELTPYFGPTDQELEEKGILAVFLGHYFQWDPQTSLEVARVHGFQTRAEGPKTGYYDYADLDDDFISIHHYLKWYKFGFTRLFDNLSLEIRNGRITRDDAMRIVREVGDQTPHEDIAKFCDFVGINKEHFFEVVEKFRNREVWVKRNGTWMIDGFLIPDWR